MATGLLSSVAILKQLGMNKNIFILFVFNLIIQNLFSQQYTYQPLIFTNITPVWQYAPIDNTLIGVGNLDGRNHFSSEKLPLCIEVFEDYIYHTEPTGLSGRIVEGGFVQKINARTGDLAWARVFDLRTEERQEYVQDLLIDDQKRLNVISVRRIVPPFIDPFFVWPVKGDSSVISIRRYDIETGELIEHKYPSNYDYSSVRVRHHLYNARFLKAFKDNTFQYLVKENEYGFALRHFILDEKGYQTREMKRDSLIFNSPHHYISNSTQPMIIVNADTIVCLNYVVKPDSTYDGQARLTIYNKDLGKRKEILLDNLIDFNYQSLFLTNADDQYIYLKGDFWLSAFEPKYNEHIILDYEGNIVKQFKTKYNGKNYYEFQIVYLAKKNEFLILGQLRERSMQLSFFKTQGKGNIIKLADLELGSNGHLFQPVFLDVIPDGGILIKGFNIVWPTGENFPQGYWPTWLKFNAEDIGLTSNAETENVRLLRIYPNPASDRITISLEEDQSGVIDILDHMGREVYVTDSEAIEGMNHINIGFLPTGMYFVRVTDKTGRINGTGRFVKMN